MSVHQTTDGRWFVRYPKGKITEAPDRTREYFGRGPEAEVKARERNHELGLGKQALDTSPLFIDLVKAYMAAKGPVMATASKIALSTKMENIVLPKLGHMRAAQITPAILDRYTASRLKKVKRTTVHRDLSDIRAILRWSAKRRYIAANPMEGFEFPNRDDAVITPPTVIEVQAILKAAAPHLYRAVILSYYTGLRPGEVELLRLTWEQIDLTNGSIVIFSADKGGLKKRVVPIQDESLLRLLGKWLKDDKLEGKKNSDPVVTYRKLPVQSLKSAWKAAKRRAKITRRIRMYDLRHSFASKLLDNGADLKHVSILLGHRSVQQTVDTYQHFSQKLSEEAVGKLPSIFEEDDI
jgi:integrase